MKRHLMDLLISLLMVLILGACQLETSGNGKLDGLWHLEQIDSVQSGTSVNLRHDMRFWAIQHRLLELEDKDRKHEKCLMRFEKKENELKVYSPYRYNREKGDEPLKAPNLLMPYGIGKTEEVFRVVKLNRKRMILRSLSVELTFQRY